MTEAQQVSLQEIDGRLNALASQRNEALNVNALLAGKLADVQHQFVTQSKELGVLKTENEVLKVEVKMLKTKLPARTYDDAVG